MKNVLAYITAFTMFSIYGHVEGVASCGNIKADVFFLIDTSTSVEPTDLENMKTFISLFSSVFIIGPNNVQIGASTFSTSVTLVFNLNSYSSSTLLLNAIKEINYKSGGTNTGEALRWVDQYAFTTSSGSRIDVPKIVIVLTDGRSDDSNKTASAAASLNNHGIKVFSIGVGSNVNMQELQAVASDHDHVLTTPSFNNLYLLQTRLQNEACNDAFLSTTATSTIGTTIWHVIPQRPLDFCASSPCQNKARCLHDVVGYVCLCSGGFTGKNCENDICSTHPCRNNGRCMEDADGFICICGKGFTGQTCETAISVPSVFGR